MRKNEFSAIRHHLGKTQSQMAHLLGTSLKAVQSFEQGWRRVPAHVERQALFLLSRHFPQPQKNGRCWAIQHCAEDRKKNCPAHEFRLGNLCWFINGTICQGKAQPSWQKKMKICRRCEVFQALFPVLYE